MAIVIILQLVTATFLFNASFEFEGLLANVYFLVGVWNVLWAGLSFWRFWVRDV